jgi:hypothetical protein
MNGFKHQPYLLMRDLSEKSSFGKLNFRKTPAAGLVMIERDWASANATAVSDICKLYAIL